MIQNAGAQLVIADGAVQSAGLAVRVFGIHIISTGGGGAIVSLRNGSTVGGTIWVTQTGTVSTGATFNFGDKGILFPSGCFVDVDANTTSVLVAFNTGS